MKNIRAFFLIVLISLISLAQAQLPPCQWAKSVGNKLTDNVKSICTDNNGNVFITGYFLDASIDFGTTTLTNTANYSNYCDLFIAKYSPEGNVLWAKSAGGIGHEFGNSISCDTSGNVFLGGYFTGHSISIETTTLISASHGTNFPADIFLAKYSPEGNLLWAKSAGGSGIDEVSGVAADLSGNVFLTGNFSSPTIVFETSGLTNSNSLANTSDAFVVKYSPNGSVLWVNSSKGYSNTYHNESRAITVDASGSAIVTGAFRGQFIVFGTTTLTNYSMGNDDAFIVKYSPTGNVLWANSAGGSLYEVGLNISSDASNNIYLSGAYTTYTMVLGTTTLTQSTYNNFYSDIFTAKYSSNGSLLWAKSFGSDYNESVSGLSVDPNGNLFLIGYFNSPIIGFGTSTLINDTGSGTSSDIFILKYSSNGNELWAKTFAGNAINKSCYIAKDGSDDIYITGSYNSNSVIFGSTTLVNVSNIGLSDVFLTKFSTNLVNIKGNHLENRMVNIYPNPFTSQISILFSQDQINTKIIILDITGNEMLKIPNFQGRELIIKKGELKEGIYFLHLTDEKSNSISRKVILH